MRQRANGISAMVSLCSYSVCTLTHRAFDPFAWPHSDIIFTLKNEVVGRYSPRCPSVLSTKSKKKIMGVFRKLKLTKVPSKSLNSKRVEFIFQTLSVKMQLKMAHFH